MATISGRFLDDMFGKRGPAHPLKRGSVDHFDGAGNLGNGERAIPPGRVARGSVPPRNGQRAGANEGVAIGTLNPLDTDMAGLALINELNGVANFVNGLGGQHGFSLSLISPRDTYIIASSLYRVKLRNPKDFPKFLSRYH